MLLRHGNIPFLNEVVPFADWPALKPKVPNNQLPQLQLGSEGDFLPNTMDIALHVAKLVGSPPLLPADEDLASSALDCWRELDGTALPYVEDPWGDATPWDARTGVVNPLLNFLPKERALLLVPRYLEGLGPWLAKLEERIHRRPEGPFMGGAAPHHGDFASFAVCDNICTLGGSGALSNSGPHVASPLLAWFASMRELPAVDSYLKSRPQAGTGTVGKPGSLIHECTDPAAVVGAYTSSERR